MHRALLLTAVPVLLLVGCGDDGGEGTTDGAEEGTAPTTTEAVAVDDDSGGDTEALCAEMAELTDIDPDVQPTQADVDRVRAVADSAEGEVADALDLIADVGQLVAGADLNDPDALADLEASTSAEEADAAGQRLAQFAAEECDGLEVPLFSSFVD